MSLANIEAETFRKADDTVDTFRVKACNPDNEPEIAQLVSLFEESYGERFPFRGVYDREYWNRSAGAELISLMAVRRRDVLAHIAARPDARDKALVQLCFPACRPDFASRAVEAARAAWKTLESLAERQQWRAVYFGAFSDVELVQLMAVDGFGLSTSAILPGYSPMLNPRCSGSRPGADRGARSHVALGIRTFRPPAESAEIFVPERHRSMISFLRTNFGGLPAPVRRQALGQVSADAPGIEEKYFKDWQAWHVFVRPSLVRDLPTRLTSLQPSAGRAFIFIDARDAACPQAADQLEQRGFIFCGLLPELAGTECLVYAQPDDYSVEADSFLCPIAKKLAEYIGAQESARLTRVQPQRLGNQDRYVAAR